MHRRSTIRPSTIRPAVVGLLTAELALAVAAAPPAGAQDAEPVADPAPTEEPALLPLPLPLPIPVRAGRTIVDLPGALPDVSLPVELDLPIRTGRRGDPGVEPAPAPAEPTPDVEPAPVAAPPAAASSDPTVAPPASTPPPAAPVPTPAPGPVGHTIAVGDNLWEVAAAELARVTGRERAAITLPEVAGYWVRVCEANRERLVSRDPDLVYPGETVVLPSVQ